MARTAAFLLLKDTRASHVIEGEDPPQDRVQRWSRAIGQAERKSLDLDELLQMQQALNSLGGAEGTLPTVKIQALSAP